MRALLLILLASLFSPSPGVAQEGGTTATQVPLFGRVLSFTLPAGMDVANRRDNGTNVLIEYVPRGETLGNWTRLVTIQAYRGLGRSPLSSAEIARQAFFPATCNRGPIWRDSGEQAIERGLTRSVIVTGCASLPRGAYPRALPGAGEQDFIYMFRDAETIYTLYTLNYAVRGAPFAVNAPPVPIDTAEALLRQTFGVVSLRAVR